jgi:transposase
LLTHPIFLETTMQFATDRPQVPAAIRTDLGAIFVSLELSRSTWLITSLSPGGGEKMSKHSVCGSDAAGLLARFARLQEKARARTGQRFPIIVIQEAGLDGFWIHRVLQIRLRSQHPAGDVDRRPIRSTASLWSAHCSPTSVVSRVSARW